MVLGAQEIEFTGRVFWLSQLFVNFALSYRSNSFEGTPKSPLFYLTKVKDTQEISAEIKALMERHIHDDHLFIVDVVVKTNGSHVTKILVLLDGDEGVSIDECADLSRSVSEELEQMDILDVKYRFEVSSPGVDHPLTYARQYPQHTGRRLQVTLKDGSEKVGTLKEVKEETLLLTEETLKGAGKAKKYVAGNDVEISFEDIEKTNVMISFN